MPYLFELCFSSLRKEEQLSRALDLIADPFNPHLIVTPNLDHLVKLRDLPEFASAYKLASLTIPDGWPLTLIARILRVDIGDRFPGSEFVPALFQSCNSLKPGLRIFLIGSPPGTNEIATEKIRTRWPELNPCGHLCPPMGFLSDPQWVERIIAGINSSKPDVIVLGLGAPTQEVLFSRIYRSVNRGLFIGAGATTEFIAGTSRRAPHAVRAVRLEWLYRMLLNPRRLALRYFRCLLLFPAIFFRAASALKNQPK